VRVLEIKLYDKLKIDTLRHRETARLVLDDITSHPKTEKIVVDFAGINFASRSFCHELKRGLIDLDFVFVNMVPEVEEMMRIAFDKPKIDFEPSLKSKKLEELVAN
jgi:hypothetical protein